MLNTEFIDKRLVRFRPLFRDHRTYTNFKKIIYGFLAAPNIYALTAIVSNLYLLARDYDRINDYFKKGSYDIDNLYEVMIRLIAEETGNSLVKVNGRTLLAGDGIKIPKEAKKDPAVKKCFVSTEDVSKKTGYVPCTTYSCVSLICAIEDMVFSMLLSARIAEGNETTEAWQGRERDTQPVKMIKEAVRITRLLKQDVYLDLDRYYLSAPLLDEIIKYNKTKGPNDPILDVVLRCKNNCQIYEDHVEDPNEPTRRGPKKKYDKRSVIDFFEERKDLFHELVIEHNGNKTVQRVYSKVWKWGRQKDKYALKILLSQRGDQKIILATTDLEMSDEDMIKAYEYRFTIEVAFRQGSEIFGMFNSHFHTQCLEPLNIYAKKEDSSPVSKITNEADKKKVLATMKATEGFVLHSMLAMNLANLFRMSSEEDPGIRYRFQQTYSPNMSLLEAKQELSSRIICSLSQGGITDINSLLSGEETPSYLTKLSIIKDRKKNRRIRRNVSSR